MASYTKAMDNEYCLIFVVIFFFFRLLLGLWDRFAFSLNVLGFQAVEQNLFDFAYGIVFFTVP